MTADTVGGVWTYSLQLARALELHGVQVFLATMGAPLTNVQRAEAEAIPSLNIFESSYKLEWMADPWEDVAQAGEWLLGLEAQTQPDLVHLNGFAHGTLPFRAPKLVVGHSCVLSWWEAVKGEPAPLEWDRYRSEVGAGIRAADMVAAPSEAMLASLHKHYGPLPDSNVVYNGRSSADFSPGEKMGHILAVGRLWDEGKNIAALERVAPRLPWPIYVAGESRHPGGGQVELGALNPLGRLSSSQLARQFAEASIYALPALYEPFGLSALEAGLCGCALVLGDIPTLREVWGDAALFVPPRDTEGLATTLQMLISNKEERERMALKARNRALQYTPERMAEGYMTAYHELIGVTALAW